MLLRTCFHFHALIRNPPGTYTRNGFSHATDFSFLVSRSGICVTYNKICVYYCDTIHQSPCSVVRCTLYTRQRTQNNYYLHRVTLQIRRYLGGNGLCG